MGFSRKGSPERIETVDIKYDKAIETIVECPKCHKSLNSIKASNGLMKKGSMVVVGKIIVKCDSCGEIVNV